VNINNQQNIVDVFSNYFLAVAYNSTIKNISNTTDNNTINTNNDIFMHFMSQAFTAKYPFMSGKPTVTRIVENKIKALKKITWI
jgi:hypothetical protein